MSDLHDNPMGTDGFEFVEYTAPDPQLLRSLFERMGFPAVARHRSKNVTLHRQGEINFIINAEPTVFAQAFARAHGPSACAMAFRVQDAARRLRRALELGAKPGPQAPARWNSTSPAIEGIGGCLIYLVDLLRRALDLRRGLSCPSSGAGARRQAPGSRCIDHLTHNVGRGRMDVWAGFYEKLFNFREIRYFDIEGKKTGLLSRAMTSPCGKIRIPINESQDDKSQIEEYLREYHGEGIQHIALSSRRHLPHGGRAARARRGVPGHARHLLRGRRRRACPATARRSRSCSARRILIDGNPQKGEGVLLQIFTQNVIGPIFFEIIQRKGNEGFGEGNFRALFESIEQDQIRRGVHLKAAPRSATGGARARGNPRSASRSGGCGALEQRAPGASPRYSSVGRRGGGHDQIDVAVVELIHQRDEAARLVLAERVEEGTSATMTDWYSRAISM